MPDYVLEINIQGRRALQYLSKKGCKLCFAFETEDDGYKVIASSMGKATCFFILIRTYKCNPDVESEAQFRWNDDFGIAASDTGFMKGGKKAQ